MSVTVDHETLQVDQLGLRTIGQVLSHLQRDNRLVVNLLTAFMAAAVVVTAVADGRRGLRSYGLRLVRWRIGWRGWALAFGAPLLLLAAACRRCMSVLSPRNVVLYGLACAACIHAHPTTVTFVAASGAGRPCSLNTSSSTS